MTVNNICRYIWNCISDDRRIFYGISVHRTDCLELLYAQCVNQCQNDKGKSVDYLKNLYAQVYPAVFRDDG